MRHTLLVVTVKRWLKSVYIYESYRKISTGVPLFLDRPVRHARYTAQVPNDVRRTSYLD